jgi:small subunit ribosomal protein S1
VTKPRLEESREEEEPDFADLLESYSNGMNDDIRVGDKISGKVIATGGESVFIDTGSKIDGVVDRAELLDEEGNLTCSVNDTLELYVVAVDDAEIRLSKAVSGIGGIEMLREAFEEQVPVEGKVSATCKGGFSVEVMKRRAFCPVSQIDLTYVETPEDYVGQTFTFLISRFEPRSKNIVVSRRILLSREQAKEREGFYADLAVGNRYEGSVVRVMPYGAFVDLGFGVEGMVHVSELSWSRVEKPEVVVAEGDTVTVTVIGLTDDEKSGRKKISLSMKQATTDPWETAGDNFSVGQKLQGRVTRCVNFGAFVEIGQGIEGLVHISEMSYTRRIVNPQDVVSPGQAVDVLVKEVDPVRRRISLSMRDAEGDPWIGVDDRYRSGQPVTGTLEKKESFGYFISLEPGVTGLLPISRISRSPRSDQLQNLKPGASITVAVDRVNTADRKISLAVPDDSDTGDWKAFKKAGPETGGGLGDLGEKLKRALEAKDNKR